MKCMIFAVLAASFLSTEWIQAQAPAQAGPATSAETPEIRASSPAGSARPSRSAMSIAARAGSLMSSATLAIG